MVFGVDRVRWIVSGVLLFAGCASAPPQKADLVWPPPPEQPRIKYLESFARKGHFGTQGADRFKEALLGPEQQSRTQLGKPLAATTDEQGNLYVTDTGGGLVWVFDRENKKVRFLGDSGNGKLATPAGVAVDARGVVFVTDAGRDRVFAFDQSGKLLLAIGQKDEFYNPAGIAIDRKTGRLYVSDTGRHKVRVYDSVSGKFIFEFGQRGTDPGQLNFPTHMFLKDDRLYVSDTGNFRVQAFTLDGKAVRTYGELGASWGKLARPKGVAVDSEGHVYVVDAAFNNFQIFNPEGELLLFVGGLGSEPGQFWLPAGLYIDSQDRIYVVDQYNRRVQVLQYMGGRFLAGAKKDNGGKQ